MILGIGPAQTEAQIFDEYRDFLRHAGCVRNAKAFVIATQTPECLRQRIGKPFEAWTDEDLLNVYVDRGESTRYRYTLFVAFVLMRGYWHASFRLLSQMHGGLRLASYYWDALVDQRQRLEKTRDRLGYFPQAVGGELSLLIALLAWAHKPLDALSRADFDDFATQYRTWYRSQNRRKGGKPDPDLKRLELYLIDWGIIPRTKWVAWREAETAFILHPAICSALQTFKLWCEAKFQPGTVNQYQVSVREFFRWLQREHPECDRLDGVTRQYALAYAHYLREECRLSTLYLYTLYHKVRAFFEFAISEQLETAPNRNPFATTDTPKYPDTIARYLTDQEVRKVLDYCENEATVRERVLITVLFHTGIRCGELVRLKASDIVQVQGRWKVHIREGKGLKDRLIPLTPECLTALRTWQENGWEHINDQLFTHHGRMWYGCYLAEIIRGVGQKIGVQGLKPHRFRHTFAVALLNYGMRESALQKLMGHMHLDMTLHYARILDQTVERAFTSAVQQMRDGALSWVPNFLKSGDYSLFVEGDAVSWIRLPHGYCRRNLKLHCESDVKCLLCDRFVASGEDLPKLQAMQERFQSLGMQAKADVVTAQIHHLRSQIDTRFVPVAQITA